MKVFNSLEEMKLYYNEKINTYEFIENNRLIDIKIDFDLNMECNIKARNIKAWNIKASDDINARDINASDINAGNINSGDIKAGNINAGNIKANNISFYAVCFAYNTFVCNSIKGRRENSKYFCLDSDVVIKSQKS